RPMGALLRRHARSVDRARAGRDRPGLRHGLCAALLALPSQAIAVRVPRRETPIAPAPQPEALIAHASPGEAPITHASHREAPGAHAPHGEAPGTHAPRGEAPGVRAAWTEVELARILEHSPLEAPPPDPTNAHADDPAAARLGQFLFFDTRLSGNGAIACAT